MDKHSIHQMAYKVVVATVGPGDKTDGPATARIVLMVPRVDLVDIKVSFVAARVDLEVAMVVGKVLTGEKVVDTATKVAIVVAKVSPTVVKVVVEQSLEEFLVGTDKFQLGMDHMHRK